MANPSPSSVSLPTTDSAAAVSGLDWLSVYPRGTMPKVSLLLQFDQVLSRCSGFMSFALTIVRAYQPLLL